MLGEIIVHALIKHNFTKSKLGQETTEKNGKYQDEAANMMRMGQKWLSILKLPDKHVLTALLRQEFQKTLMKLMIWCATRVNG